MIKWYRDIHLFGFAADQPCQHAASGTRRRLKGNERNPHDLGNRRRKESLRTSCNNGHLLHAVAVVVTVCVAEEEEKKESREGGRSLSERWWWRERTRAREQSGLQIAIIHDTKEGNASDTMHACSQIVGCQC